MKVTIGQTLSGAAGTAKELLVTSEPTDKKDHPACLSSWFIDAPGQCPIWHIYGWSVVHLREIAGRKPAQKWCPHMTHEFFLIAMNPEMNPEPLRPESWSWLSPVNFVQQLELPDDGMALRICEAAAQAVCDGRLWAEPPLSGMKEPWATTLIHWARDPECCLPKWSAKQ